MLLMSPLVRYLVIFSGFYVSLYRVPGGSDRCGEHRLCQGFRVPSSNELAARRTLPKVLGPELVLHCQW